MGLHDLHAPRGATHKRTRVGRGESSGHGKTSGRGGKGQTARTGKGKPGRGFEGGQMPMYRRMPKRGFTNVFAKEWAVVNVDSLGKVFAAGAIVDTAALIQVGLATRRVAGLRILGRGELALALEVRAHHFSESARSKIEGSGGKAVVLSDIPQASAAS